LTDLLAKFARVSDDKTIQVFSGRQPVGFSSITSRAGWNHIPQRIVEEKTPRYYVIDDGSSFAGEWRTTVETLTFAIGKQNLEIL
jgi:hypothetical protein